MTVVFVLARVVPGDPALVILGDQASAEALAALRERLGLDRPLFTQYLEFLGGILTATSAARWSPEGRVVGGAVRDLVHDRAHRGGVVIGVVFGVPLGMYAAVHRNRLPDTITRIVSLAGLSFPAFVSAILLLLVFAIHLKWFPVLSRRRRWTIRSTACATWRSPRSTSASS